ncbi:MAG: transcription elongation factor GreA [Chthonomonadales bacterium]
MMSDQIILTASSYKKLQDELDHMKTVKRGEMAEALRKARAYGDLSENFEYHAARRDQGILNGKIEELERTLDVAKILDSESRDIDVIGLGAVVMVKDLDMEEEWEFYIVDVVQADPVNDRISNQSPVAQALTGKRAGEVVEVQIPQGMAKYEIVSIRWED